MNLPPEIKGLIESVGQSLNAYSTDNPQDPNYLGEPWRSHLLELKGRLNSSLDKLPPLDQVPAAQEAHWGMAAVKSALLSVQSIIQSLSGFIKARSDEVATAKATITPEIENGIKAKLESGEYLTKEAASALAATARTEGETAGFAKGKLMADRRSALAVAGLPAEVAATAPEAILIGEEAAFNTARDTAKTRVDKLTGIGLTIATSPDAVRQLPWGAEEQFASQFTTFEAIKNANRGQANASVPDAGKTQPPNPFAGGASAKPAKTLNIVC